MSGPLLRTKALVKHYGGLRVTDEASLDVHKGEIHALICPNGAGKSTLINLLSGVGRPDSGKVIFDDVDITREPAHVRAQRGLVRSFQVTSVFPRLTVMDNLALAAMAHETGLGFWNQGPRARTRRAACVETAERIGLDGLLARRAGSLSHGQQRQLELGLALLLRPKLLLLDEPMAGTGPEESEAMVAFLQGLRGQVTVLLVEHDMDAVFRLADRITTLVAGKVIACGTPREIRDHAGVRSAYLGEEALEVGDERFA
jgi:branched-chain amino acid transport system ATP-binding protein